MGKLAMMNDFLVKARNELLRFFGGVANEDNPIHIELPPAVIEKAIELKKQLKEQKK